MTQTTVKILNTELEAYLDALILGGDSVILIYPLPYSSSNYVYVTYVTPA